MNKTPAIILVRPQLGENIGAAARAMLNFGLSDLRLVAPRDGWPNPQAFSSASGALDEDKPTDERVKITLYSNLPESISDCHMTYATTARDRDLNKPVYDLEDMAIQNSEHLQKGEQTAIIFGPERTGLTNEDLSYCHTLITIPTNPLFSSLNLSQAVLCVCHTLSRYIDQEKIISENNNRPATADQTTELINRTISLLEENHFFRSADLKPTMIQNIRTMLTRPRYSDQEVRTMHGILSALIGNKTSKS